MEAPDHALLVACRSGLMACPFGCCKILHVMASHTGRFKRRHLAEVYAAHGIRLADDQDE
jgi:hypothetical protein